jgi:hypothetical protein
MKAFGNFDTIPESGISAYREGAYLMLSFDFKKVEEKKEGTDKMQDLGDNYYQFETIHMNGATDYSLIVSAIINDKYSADDVQALIANYTEAVSNDEPSDKDKEYIEEYKTFQEYRKHAKEIAKAVTEMEGV